MEKMFNNLRTRHKRGIIAVIIFAVLIGAIAGLISINNRNIELANAAPYEHSYHEAKGLLFKVSEQTDTTKELRVGITERYAWGGDLTILFYSDSSSAMWKDLPSENGAIIHKIKLFTTTVVPSETLATPDIYTVNLFEINGLVTDGTKTYRAYFYIRTPGGFAYYFPSFVEVKPTKKIIPLPDDPVKTGYTFDGWYYDANFTLIYDGAPIYEETSLYAKFTPITYSIAYTLNNGSVSGQATSYNIEKATITLPTPTRTGYTFGGWFETSGFSGSAVSQIPQGSNGNKAYFAKWDINNYSISYEVNGGSISGQTTSYTIENATITLPTPTRTGYTFGGWFESSDFGGSAVTQITQGSIGDKSYFAKWAINSYTVSFVTNNNIANFIQTIDYNNKAIIPNELVREGYVFKGWFTDVACKNDFSFNTAITGNMTLYAGWEIKTYKVTFIVDGAEYHTVTVEHGSILGQTAESAALLKILGGEVFADSSLAFAFNSAILEDAVVYGAISENALKWVDFAEFCASFWWVFVAGGVLVLALVIFLTVKITTKIKG